MTKIELELISEILKFARGKAFTDNIIDAISQAQKIVNRELNLKEIENKWPKVDINGNMMDYE